MTTTSAQMATASPTTVAAALTAPVELLVLVLRRADDLHMTCCSS